MGTTAHGIVYPESGDHTRLWEHFETLAESVEDNLAASSWVDLAGVLLPASGWTVTSARYLLKGEAPPAAGEAAEVVLDLAISRTGGTITFSSVGNIADTTIATALPSDLVPPDARTIQGDVSGILTARTRVNTDGTLAITHGTSGASILTGHVLRIHDSYWLG